MDFSSSDFDQYLLPDTDRATFITNWLKEHNVDSKIIVLENKRHVLVQFNSRFYNPQFKIKTVIAHHDRVLGSPGANDNSAANFILMNWAVELNKYKTFHNIRLIFTDGEELGWNSGVIEQGAFAIANIFKRLGIVNDDVFVFDACGRGEIPILSKCNFGKSAPKSFIVKLDNLYNRTQNILKRACKGRWMSLPVPYSDNASFLACGIPAVAITMLPAQEASVYARELITDKKLEESVLNRETSKTERLSGVQKDYGYKDRIPLTWKLFHTEKDNIQSLTKESITVMNGILYEIADSKVPLV